MRALPLLSLAWLACAPRGGPPTPLREVAANELRAPADFDAIPNRKERSQAIFLEMSRVLLHPRCANCHPDGDSPLQGPAMVLHEPPVTRGTSDEHGGHGAPGAPCTGCHQDRNLPYARVPGAPKWALAPREMAWVGKSPAYICAQLSDPARNGNKTLDEIVEHNAHDALVAWGWAPGADREPAPGTQAAFGALSAAWVKTGAVCPEEAR